LIRFIRGDEGDQAIAAWGSVMGCLEAGRSPKDPKTVEVIRRLGGWTWLQSCSYDELKWQEKRFVEHYSALGDDFDKEQLPEGEGLRQLTAGIGRAM
jgi:hypothetical protein